MKKFDQTPRQQRSLLGIVLFAILVITIILWFFRSPLQNRITAAGVLSNNAPPAELVEEMIRKAADPEAALLAAWNSNKIIHREVAVGCLAKLVPNEQPLPPAFDTLLISATLDPDMNVRETALGILRNRKDSRLAALAAEQLRDPDQKVRMLGLFQFKFVSPAVGIPAVIPLLDDPNPLIVTKSLNLLDDWTGEKFGVKFKEIATLDESKTGVNQYNVGGHEIMQAGVNRARAWFAEHQSQFPPIDLQMPELASFTQPILPAPDFELRTIDGKKVRFSDFRGKVVLINFWTTWCTACVSEMPELVALQNKFQGKLVIIGVSLDLVPDEDDKPISDPKQAAAAAKLIHEKIARTVQQRGINYPVLLDEHNEAGGCYNGGELPTTVIVDAQGNIRRRFIGARSLPEFEAILAEAGSNLPPVDFQQYKPARL